MQLLSNKGSNFQFGCKKCGLQFKGAFIRDYTVQCIQITNNVYYVNMEGGETFTLFAEK